EEIIPNSDGLLKVWEQVYRADPFAAGIAEALDGMMDGLQARPELSQHGGPLLSIALVEVFAGVFDNPSWTPADLLTVTQVMQRTVERFDRMVPSCSLHHRLSARAVLPRAMAYLVSPALAAEVQALRTGRPLGEFTALILTLGTPGHIW